MTFKQLLTNGYKVYFITHQKEDTICIHLMHPDSRKWVYKWMNKKYFVNNYPKIARKLTILI